MQAWLIGRANLGGTQFVADPQEAEELTHKMFGIKLKNFIVDKILVWEKLKIKK